MPKIKEEVLISYNTERPKEMPFWDEIICGDSVELIKTIPSNSVDLVITSPPYFQQREYDGGGIGNEKTPDEYVAALMRIFSESVRIIKSTGSIIFNIGDKYENKSLRLMPYRFAIAATEKYDVVLVNDITWVKSNPTPRQFRRRLVSSTESFFHFVKTQEYKYFPDDFLKSLETQSNGKNAGKNIGKSYFSLIKSSALSPEQKEMATNALEEAIHDVHKGEIQSFRMKIRGIHAEPFGGQNGGRKIQLDKNGFTIIRIHGRPLKKDAIITPVESLKNCPHPAIYPVRIVDEFIKLLTQKGDIVFDPFVGSGSTAVAAYQNERRYIGFDISKEYCLYAQERLSNVKHQLSLWEKNDEANTYTTS